MKNYFHLSKAPEPVRSQNIEIRSRIYYVSEESSLGVLVAFLLYRGTVVFYLICFLTRLCFVDILFSLYIAMYVHKPHVHSVGASPVTRGRKGLVHFAPVTCSSHHTVPVGQHLMLATRSIRAAEGSKGECNCCVHLGAIKIKKSRTGNNYHIRKVCVY